MNFLLLAANTPSDFVMELLGGGIFAVLIINSVLNFLSKRKENGATACQFHCQQQVADLHKWHQPNAGGEQHWKGTRMLDLVEKLNDTVAGNTKVLEKLVEIFSEKFPRKS